MHNTHKIAFLTSFSLANSNMVSFWLLLYLTSTYQDRMEILKFRAQNKELLEVLK